MSGDVNSWTYKYFFEDEPPLERWSASDDESPRRQRPVSASPAKKRTGSVGTPASPAPESAPSDDDSDCELNAMQNTFAQLQEQMAQAMKARSKKAKRCASKF